MTSPSSPRTPFIPVLALSAAYVFGVGGVLGGMPASLMSLTVITATAVLSVNTLLRLDPEKGGMRLRSVQYALIAFGLVGGILHLGRMMSAEPGAILVSLEMHAAMALYACSFLVIYRRVAHAGQPDWARRTASSG